MLISKITEGLNDVNHRYDIRSMKLDAVVESCKRELCLGIKKAEIVAIQENTSNDEYFFMVEEASDGFVNKMKDTIIKIIEAFKKFIDDIKLRVLTFFNKKETEEALDTVEKKVRFNPFLKNKKVQVKDTKAAEKQIDETSGLLAKLAAKIKGGSKVTTDDVDEVMSRHHKTMTKIAIATTAVVTITIGALLILTKKSKDDVSKTIDDSKKVAEAVGKELMELTNNENMSAEASAATIAVAKAVNDVEKERVNVAVEKSKGCISTLVDSMRGVKLFPKLDDDGTVKKESYYDNLYDESSVDDFLSDIESEFF